jgi:hypothetical protein
MLYVRLPPAAASIDGPAVPSSGSLPLRGALCWGAGSREQVAAEVTLQEEQTTTASNQSATTTNRHNPERGIPIETVKGERVDSLAEGDPRALGLARAVRQGGGGGAPARLSVAAAARAAALVGLPLLRHLRPPRHPSPQSLAAWFGSPTASQPVFFLSRK